MPIWFSNSSVWYFLAAHFDFSEPRNAHLERIDQHHVSGPCVLRIAGCDSALFPSSDDFRTLPILGPRVASPKIGGFCGRSRRNEELLLSPHHSQVPPDVLHPLLERWPRSLLSILGYIALFVPTQMNRQVTDSVIVGIYMSLYACISLSLFSLSF